MSFHRHHEKRKLAVNLFTIPMFIIILVVATFFSKPIRRVVNIPKKLVAGVHDNNFQDVTKENFSNEIVNDTKDQVNTVKNDVLQTTIGDIINFIGKGSKIKSDITNLQKQTVDTVDSFDPTKIDPKKLLPQKK